MRVIHHRQSLSLSLKPPDYTPGIHAQLQYLEGNRSSNRVLLLDSVNPAPSSLSHQFHETVGANLIAQVLPGEINNVITAPGRIFNAPGNPRLRSIPQVETAPSHAAHHLHRTHDSVILPATLSHCMPTPR